MKYVVLWDVVLCWSCFNGRFGGTLVNPGYTQRHMPEDDILQVENSFILGV
jgi:hypothetical protein